MEFNTIDVLKAMADPIRLSIIKRLYNKCELCACNILDDFEISQPTLSFHMKKLTSCGLVKVRKEGVWMRYSINTEFMDQLRRELEFNVSALKEEQCEESVL